MTNISSCYLCGGPMRNLREAVEIRIGQRSAVVEVERLHCEKCGELFVTPENMDAAQVEAAGKMRAEDGLLTPSEIIRIRQQFGLTQSELERLLGVGPKTVVRWERGTVFQGRTADQLLRILQTVSGAFEFLSAKSGLNLSRVYQIPTGNQKHHYVLRDKSSATNRPKADRVVSISDFRSQTQQRKRVQLDREATLPTISVEAMR